MSDLKSPKLIYFKASLFLMIIIGSVALALIEFPSWKLAVLILIAIWASARLYYFMFYVIEKYVDPDYKFSGIYSFVLYLLSSKPARIAKH